MMNGKSCENINDMIQSNIICDGNMRCVIYHILLV